MNSSKSVRRGDRGQALVIALEVKAARKRGTSGTFELFRILTKVAGINSSDPFGCLREVAELIVTRINLFYRRILMVPTLLSCPCAITFRVQVPGGKESGNRKMTWVKLLFGTACTFSAGIL